VVRFPHPALRQAAEPVERITDSLRTLAEDLADTMRAMPATVGLAAPQVGEAVRVLVLDVRGHPRADTAHGLVVLFDPEVIEASDPDLLREGCLSIPDLTANVRRARRIQVRGLSSEGSSHDYRMRGFEARVLLHEVDHLEGVVILDRVAAPSDLFPRKVYR
jgi:peptide deformylase